MESQINKHSSSNRKEGRESKMNIIKWNDIFFNESVTYIWVYNNGLLISTNNRKSKSFIIKGFRSTKAKIHTDAPAEKHL